MQCEKKDGAIILRPMAVEKVIGIMATVFACVGICVFVTMISEEDIAFFAGNPDPVSLIGIVFLTIWILFSGFVAYSTLYSKLRYRIVIDRNGVCEMGVLFRKSQKKLRWSEIRDYGYYFSGNLNANGQNIGMYTLYFSPTELDEKDAFRKKKVRNMIRIDIDERDLMEIAEHTVFPYCCKYCSFEPRIVEIVNHFM